MASELQLAALRMSVVDFPTALALEVTAVHVEWAEKTEMSLESAITLFIHLATYGTWFHRSILLSD